MGAHGLILVELSSGTAEVSLVGRAHSSSGCVISINFSIFVFCIKLHSAYQLAGWCCCTNCAQSEGSVKSRKCSTRCLGEEIVMFQVDLLTHGQGGSIIQDWRSSTSNVVDGTEYRAEPSKCVSTPRADCASELSCKRARLGLAVTERGQVRMTC